MNDAEKLMRHPTKDVTAAAEGVRKASAASESQARADFLLEDGSMLVVHSFAGSKAEAVVIAAGEDQTVPPPSLPHSPGPEGLQDDGTNTYDENPPEGLVEVDD